LRPWSAATGNPIHPSVIAIAWPVPAQDQIFSPNPA